MRSVLDNRYFFFDFDGVIADSMDIKTRAFAEIYGPHGEEVVGRVVSHHLEHGGISRFDKFRLYHREYLNRELTGEELAGIVGRFSGMVVEKVINAPYIAGALELLDLLLYRKRDMFVVSGTPEEEMRAIVERKGLGKYFRDVTGAPESKSENLMRLTEKYDVDVSNALLFGDSRQDRIAAASAGMRFVPINYSGRGAGYRDFIEFIEKEVIL